MKRKKRTFIAAALTATAIIPAVVINADVTQASTEVVFADSNLHAAIAVALGKAPTDPITQSDMETLTDLNFADKNITNLDGIEYAINLKKFTSSKNPISNLAPLSNLSNLENLSIYNSNISDVSPLSGLLSLKDLTIAFGEITDLSPLAGLSNLNSLIVVYNKIDYTVPANMSVANNFSGKFPGFWGNYQRIGTVVVKYIDENNIEIDSETKNHITLDDPYTVTAKLINGYSLIGSNTQNVNLTHGNLTETITFNMQKLGIITVNYVDENGTVIETKNVPDVPIGTHTEAAKAIIGYTLNDDATKTVTVDTANLTHTITFSYTTDTPITPPTPPAVLGTITVNYIDENGTIIETKNVPDVPVGTHTETAKAITGYTLNDDATKTVTVDTANVTHTIIFSYKKDKLITPAPVNPAPTPEPMPVNPAPTPEPMPVSPTPTPEPMPVNPTPTPEKTPAVSENHNNGNYEWTLDFNKAQQEGLIKDDQFIFEAEGIKITVPLKELKEFEKLVVSWIHLGQEHYQLIIKVDGKEINLFSKPVKIEKVHGFAYLIRGENGEYAAIPYTYKNGKFYFETKNIQKPFYFSTNKRTFTDIKGLYSQAAIEQLASRYIVFGTSEQLYSPQANTTRAQFSAMLVRGLGLEPNNLDNVSFSDTVNHWAAQDIQALYEKGILKGAKGSFKPNEELTRKQAILIIYRLLKEYGVEIPNAAPNFEDGQLLNLDSELVTAAGALQGLEIFVGYNGYLNPNEKLTRVQMAKVLELVIQKVGKY